MEPQKNSGEVQPKPDSSADDNNPVGEKPNNFPNRRGGHERFGGRGGRFGGRGGGHFQNQKGNDDRKDFQHRRGRGGFNSNRGGGGGGGGGNFKMEKREDNHDGDHTDGHEGGGGGGGGGGGSRQEGQGGRGRFGNRGPDDKFNERVQQLSGSTFDLPAVPMVEKKFNGRNRLYIGNVAAEVTEEDVKELFKQFGEIAEVFINKEKNFGFVKLDYHSNAEKAKRELDGVVLKSRNLKIRFAPNSASIKVKNLTPFVSNELLHYAFSVFGEIEKCIVCVDERGKPTGEAIIDFTRKGSAMHALRKCTEGCFFLTGSLRPCIVELYEIVDDIDGYPERNMPKKNMAYNKEREVGPRFAAAGSFENEYGMRWKQLYDLYTQKEEALKKEMELEKEKLAAQMEYAKYEHETEMLRDQLRAREMDKERQKREWELKQRQVEEERLRAEEQMRRTQEEMESRLMQQQEDLRRRQQENNLFMQAHTLDNMLDQQEQAYDQPTGYNAGMEDNGPMDPKTFMSSYERHGNRYDGRDSSRGSGNMGGGGGGGSSRGHWVNDNRRGDDFAPKRRRF